MVRLSRKSLKSLKSLKLIKAEPTEEIYTLFKFIRSIRDGLAFGMGSAIAYQLIHRTFGAPPGMMYAPKQVNIQEERKPCICESCGFINENR